MSSSPQVGSTGDVATVEAAAGSWLWAALSSRESLMWTLLLAAGAIGFALAARAMWRIGRATLAEARRAGDAGDDRGERGTAVIEFALVLPFAMFFILMMAQVMLLMVGNLFVHYSAFAAARAAVVQIGADDTARSGEAQNEIFISPQSAKYRAIHEAAAIALWPVGGPLDGGPQLGGTDVAAMLPEIYGSFGREAPGWVSNVLPQRLPWALQHTHVTLLAAEASNGEVALYRIDGFHEFGPRDAVTVRVDHALHLSIPWVRAFFDDGGPGAGAGELQWPSSPATHVTARSTLTNEGIPRAMPPLPEIERAPTQ